MILRPVHFRAIELLVGTDLMKKRIAAELGIVARTLSRWLRDETFREELARQQEVQPYHLDGLRLDAARKLLLDIARRLETGEESVPIKEVAQLLAKLVGREFADRSAPESEGDEYDDDGPELTPEETERLWQELEAKRRGGDPPKDVEKKGDASPVQPAGAPAVKTS